MQKDVIYIDVEDDITAIIGKLKTAKHKIVALVPPKRVGVLQSAVNLRLLARSAEQNEKRLVIITNNHALSSLAASASIPVAKNLQSKPEIAEIAALEIDDGDDIIDGASLPIGDHARLGDTDDTDTEETDEKTPPTKKPKKVPNFDTFRKKLVIGGVAGALVIAFFVWAIVFAPHAKIILLARTTETSVSQQVQLSTTAETSVSSTTLRVTEKQTSKDVSIDFEATGKKNIGTKATGNITMSTCSGLATPTAIPSGTTVSYGMLSYTTSAVGNFAFDSIGNGCINYTTGSVPITAKSGGADSNVDNANFSVAEFNSVTGTGSASGGTDKMAAVISEDDLNKAKQSAEAATNKEQLRKDLESQVGSSFVVIAETFDVKFESAKSNPAVDSELSSGRAKYSGTASASIFAVSREELGKYLDTVLEQQLDDRETQRVYDNGISRVAFSNVIRTDKRLTVNLSTNGRVGPRIDEANIKKLAAGKGYGEIQSALTSINGIAEADIKFSPFWVRSAPNDTSKISIEFKVDE